MELKEFDHFFLYATGTTVTWLAGQATVIERAATQCSGGATRRYTIRAERNSTLLYVEPSEIGDYSPCSPLQGGLMEAFGEAEFAHEIGDEVIFRGQEREDDWRPRGLRSIIIVERVLTERQGTWQRHYTVNGDTKLEHEVLLAKYEPNQHETEIA